MKLSDFTNKLSSLEITALVVFVLYIIFPFRTPSFLIGVVNTPVGLVTILIITLFLFFYTNPILGVIGFFVAYDLIRRSSVSTGNFGIDNYLPTEETKQAKMSSYNQYPYTLEQEMVKKMAPINQTGSTLTQSSYKPVLDNTHEASQLY